jgi:hypothetical protein
MVRRMLSRLLYRGSKSLMLLMSGIEAMHQKLHHVPYYIDILPNCLGMLNLGIISTFFTLRSHFINLEWLSSTYYIQVSVVGRLYSVQYKIIFGAPDKVRRDTCEEARPSRLDFQRDKVVLDIKTYPAIADGGLHVLMQDWAFLRRRQY